MLGLPAFAAKANHKLGENNIRRILGFSKARQNLRATVGNRGQPSHLYSSSISLWLLLSLALDSLSFFCFFFFSFSCLNRPYRRAHLWIQPWWSGRRTGRHRCVAAVGLAGLLHCLSRRLSFLSLSLAVSACWIIVCNHFAMAGCDVRIYALLDPDSLPTLLTKR